MGFGQSNSCGVDTSLSARVDTRFGWTFRGQRCMKQQQRRPQRRSSEQGTGPGGEEVDVEVIDVCIRMSERKARCKFLVLEVLKV